MRCPDCSTSSMHSQRREGSQSNARVPWTRRDADKLTLETLVAAGMAHVSVRLVEGHTSPSGDVSGSWAMLGALLGLVCGEHTNCRCVRDHFVAGKARFT